MIDYFIGTMGFSYQDWAGVLYPVGAPARDYLEHYSRIFNAVEIDSTFYGIPKPSSVRRWIEQSPEDFKICLKLPRAITHEAGLVDTHDELTRFLDTVGPIGERLGVILIQFPPSFDVSNQAKFEGFLQDLPEDFKYAVEFRHTSWYSENTADILSRHGVCWTATEYPGVPKEVGLTTDVIFLRLVGQHGRFRIHNREQIDVTPQLEQWWQWIRSKSDHVHSVYAFFNDDYSGYAPASANKLKKMIGLPIKEPQIPKQLRFL